MSLTFLQDSQTAIFVVMFADVIERTNNSGDAGFKIPRQMWGAKTNGSRRFVLLRFRRVCRLAWLQLRNRCAIPCIRTQSRPGLYDGARQKILLNK